MKHKIHLDADPVNSGDPWKSLCGRLTLPVPDGHKRFEWILEDGWDPSEGGDYCKFCLNSARYQLHVLAKDLP